MNQLTGLKKSLFVLRDKNGSLGFNIPEGSRQGIAFIDVPFDTRRDKNRHYFETSFRQDNDIENLVDFRTGRFCKMHVFQRNV